jgi:hypothetical protein
VSPRTWLEESTESSDEEVDANVYMQVGDGVIMRESWDFNVFVQDRLNNWLDIYGDDRGGRERDQISWRQLENLKPWSVHCKRRKSLNYWDFAIMDSGAGLILAAPEACLGGHWPWTQYIILKCV